MEAQGDPFRRGLPTLQTSLTLPELPCTATAGLVGEDFLRFWYGGCRAGKFLVDWEVRTSEKCGFAPDLWVGCVGRVYAFRKCRLIPPHQSLTRQLPPKGKPSLHCANMANMVLHCGLPLRFALIALSCSAKRLLQKGFPSGGSCRVRA